MTPAEAPHWWWKVLPATAALLLTAQPTLAQDPGPEASPMPEVEDVVRDRAWFRTQVEDSLRGAEEVGATTGIVVRDAKTGRVYYRHNAHTLLNPASNVKLVTTAAAMVTMGTAYRFPTEVFVDRPPVEGVVHGNIYLKGYGDPRLVNEELFGLTSKIASAGIQRVTGRLILDDTWFDSTRLGAGWEQERGDHSYLAPVGALSVNFNTIGVRIGPAAQPGQSPYVALEPPVDYIQLQNRATTTRYGWPRIKVQSLPSKRNNTVVVLGRVPRRTRMFRVFRRVDNPPFYAGSVFRYQLGLLGVTIDGATDRGRVPEAARLIERHLSPRLADISSDVNKVSNNFMAEQLLKALGAYAYEAPGSWEKGLRAVGDFTEKHLGIPREAYLMGNGSGLNDVNRFTAEQLSRLLVFMYNRFGVSPEYISSMGIAGRDGTIGRRMDDTEAEGSLRAKTGSLTGVSALSGYVEGADEQVLVFSMMMNGFTGSARNMWEVQDAIGAALAQTDIGAEAVTATAGDKGQKGGEPAIVP